MQRFVPGVTLEEINKVARDWAGGSRVVLVNAPEKPSVAMPDAVKLAAVISSAAQKDIKAYVDTAASQTLLDSPPQGGTVTTTRTLEFGVLEWQLSNGVKVVLKPTRFKQDEVVFRATSPGGTSLATDKLAVLNPAGGAFTSVLARVPTVAGPTGVVVDDARHRIYVVGRFRNQLQMIQADSLKSLYVGGIGFDPTPDPIVNGRKFFYKGTGSAHGDQSCATCHLFGDSDFAAAISIAWMRNSRVSRSARNPSRRFRGPGGTGSHPVRHPRRRCRDRRRSSGSRAEPPPGRALPPPAVRPTRRAVPRP